MSKDVKSSKKMSKLLKRCQKFSDDSPPSGGSSWALDAGDCSVPADPRRSTPAGIKGHRRECADLRRLRQSCLAARLQAASRRSPRGSDHRPATASSRGWTAVSRHDRSVHARRSRRLGPVRSGGPLPSSGSLNAGDQATRTPSQSGDSKEGDSEAWRLQRRDSEESDSKAGRLLAGRLQAVRLQSGTSSSRASSSGASSSSTPSKRNVF